MGFWFGSVLIEHDRMNIISDRPYNLGDVMTIFLCITMSSMIMAQIPPPIKAFVQAKDSATSMFYVINRQPKIKINDQTKKHVEQVMDKLF